MGNQRECANSHQGTNQIRLSIDINVCLLHSYNRETMSQAAGQESGIDSSNTTFFFFFHIGSSMAQDDPELLIILSQSPEC